MPEVRKVRLSDLGTLLRLPYWTKNLLVFVPAFLAGALGDPVVFAHCAAGFVLMCMTASATYILNDILDIAADRQHPSKKRRPLASGAISLYRAGILAGFLFVVALGSALVWRPDAGAALLAYSAASLLYTLVIKKMILVDTLWLAGMHSARLMMGVVLTGVPLSGWLITFALVFFLSLSLAKRYAEIILAQTGAAVPGRSYTSSDAMLVLAFGASTAVGALLVLALYVTDHEQSVRLYQNPDYLWLAVLLVGLWMLHVWRHAHAGTLTVDPVNFALGDRVSLTHFILLMAVMLVAR